MPVFWFTVKVLALLFGTVWVRASLPRMRYDKLMSLGWKWLIETALIWVVISAAFIYVNDKDYDTATTIIIDLGILAGAALAGLVLYLAMPKPGEPIEEFR
jgi:NADH-quinone oxidoreductase subunit H